MRKVDMIIDTLIRPPRPILPGLGWAATDRLKPNGAAEQERLVAEKYRPAKEDDR